MLKSLWRFLGMGCLWLASVGGASGQTTVALGRVFDGETGEPLPFVHVVFTGAGAGAGTTTGLDGTYRLATDASRPGLLSVSFLGYATQQLEIRRGIVNRVDIALEPRNVLLMAAEVRPDKKAVNPAKPLMERVIEAKDRNNPERIGGLKHRQYTRIELDINDISLRQTQRWYWGPFDWVFDYMDSSEARPALPFLIAETDATVLHRNQPSKDQTIYHVSQMSGLENSNNPAELSTRFQDLNLYDNRLLLLDRAFTSPLHDRGGLHYRFYILDTLEAEGRAVFHLAFVPRRRGELTFEGELWVDTLTLALQQVEARVSPDANLNFVRELAWRQTYFLQDSVWLLRDEYTLLDLSWAESTVGAYLRRTLRNADFEVSETLPDSAFRPGADLIYEESAAFQRATASDFVRPVPLLPREAGIYEMIDSLTAMRSWKLLKGAGYFLGTGFVQMGPLELGAWWSAWSENAVEGERYRLDLRTSNAFSKRWMPSVYVAYGAGDGRWKGGGSVRWIQRKSPRTEWTFNAQRDMEQFGMAGFFGQGDLLTTALRTNPSSRLSEVVRLEGTVLHTFGRGFTLEGEGAHRRVAPRGDLLFREPTTGEPIATLVTSEARMLLRYAPGERFVSGEFDRVSLGTERAQFTADVTLGLPNVAGSQYRYERYTLGVTDIWRLGFWGHLWFQGEAGAYRGSAPFPLMEVVPASGTLIYDRLAFNLLNFYEFVADRWVRGALEWHAEGVVFNHLPAIRRLGWREVASAKAVVGGWDTRHESLLALPEGTSGLAKPVVEVSVGIENVFRFLRFDVVRRLDVPSDPERPVWGVRMGFSVEI